RREDDQPGIHHVGQKMPAGGDAAEPDQRAERQGAGDRRVAPSSKGQQKREADQRETERGMPRDKGAVALALRGRERRRGELMSAAEFRDLIRPRPSPMVLQQRVSDQPGAERGRRDEKRQRLAVEPPSRP